MSKEREDEKMAEENAVETNKEERTEGAAPQEETPTEEIRDPKAVLDALERAKTDAKSFREKSESYEEEIANLKKNLEDLEKQPNTWKDKFKDFKVRQALAEAGVKNVDGVLRLIGDDNEIELDDDGNLVGFEESFDKVKKEWPELFDKRMLVGGAADIFSKGESKRQLTSTDIQLAALRKHR